MKGATIFVDFEFQLERGAPCKLIEIGAVRLYDGQLTTFTSLIKQKGITQETLAFTGITREELQEAPSYKDVSLAFLAFIGAAPTFVFFSYQDREVLYDNRFLEAILAESRLIDYQEKMMVHLNEMRMPSLSALLQMHHLPHEVAHRALSDAQALYELYEVTDGDAVLTDVATTIISIPFVRRLLKKQRDMVEVTLYQYNIRTGERQTYEWKFEVPHQEIDIEVELLSSGLLSSLRTTVVEKQWVYGKTDESTQILEAINAVLQQSVLFVPSHRCSLVNLFFDYSVPMTKCEVLPYFQMVAERYTKEDNERVSKTLKAAHQQISTQYVSVFAYIDEHLPRFREQLHKRGLLDE